MKVGYIGLGNMGAPMAAHLLEAGNEVVVHDIDIARAGPLLERGAKWADNPAVLAQDTDVICTCVPGPVEMRELYLGERGLLVGVRPDVVLVDHTTNDPECVREVGARLSDVGASLLDAPLDGGREGALAGSLNLFVGGSEAELERVRPALECSARSVVHVGSLGSGSVTKIVHNALAMSIDLLLTESLTVGVKAGVALGSLVEAFGKGSIVSENMTFTQRMPATLFKGDFDARFALRLAHKDFELARDLCRKARVPTQLLDICGGEIAEALARGWGDRDRTAASMLQEERAGVTLRLAPAP